MVWWDDSYKGVKEIHFCEKGLKAKAKVYQNTILQPIVILLNVKLFNGQDRSFQQDNAFAHKVKTMSS